MAKKEETKKVEKTEEIKATKEVKSEPKTKEVKEEAKQEEKPQERKKAVNIELHELIEVRSVNKGGLTYKSPKTGVVYRWEECGNIEYLEFAELMTMKSAKPRFLNEPFIVIDDVDVVEKLGLTKLYDEMYDVNDIDNFFDLSVTKMSKLLETMPNGIKTLIGDKAVSMIKDESLYDIRKIKLIEESVKIDLQILMD